MAIRRAAAIDANQNEIVKALRDVGALVVLTHTLKNAFDILVGYRGKWFAIEIKDGEKMPNKFVKMLTAERDNYLMHKKLSDGEFDFMIKAAAVGCSYTIIYDVATALKAIGAN